VIDWYINHNISWYIWIALISTHWTKLIFPHAISKRVISLSFVPNLSLRSCYRSSFILSMALSIISMMALLLCSLYLPILLIVSFIWFAEVKANWWQLSNIYSQWLFDSYTIKFKLGKSFSTLCYRVLIETILVCLILYICELISSKSCSNMLATTSPWLFAASYS